MNRKINFLCGKSVKWDGDKRIKPIFGFNWWVWIPYLRLRFRNRFSLEFSWLCYWLSIISLPKLENNAGKGSSKNFSEVLK